MTKKIETEEAPIEIEVPTPESDYRDAQIAELRNQVEGLENFLNIVIGQRNDAQNQTAQAQSQLLKLQKQIQNQGV